MKRLLCFIVILFCVFGGARGDLYVCVHNVYPRASQVKSDELYALKAVEKYIDYWNIRRLCIDVYYDYMMDCELYKCLKAEGDGFYKNLPLRINKNFDLENNCDTFLRDYNCVDLDVGILTDKLLDLDTAKVRNELIYNMDNLIAELDKGDYYALSNIGQIPGVCYYVNSKNETIWHAIARTKTHRCASVEDGDSMWQECVSISYVRECVKAFVNDEEKMSEFLLAAFLVANDDGKTPIALAIENGQLTQYRYFRQYFEENNVNHKQLLKVAADEAGVPYNKFLDAWERKTKYLRSKKSDTLLNMPEPDIETKKKIDVGKSGINIKTRY